MATRLRNLTIKREEADAPHVEKATLPLLASCTFCDDVRQEANGKLLMIGCYPGNVIVANPVHPITQLWLFTKLMWQNDFDATGLRVRVDLMAQGTAYMDVIANPGVNDALARTATCIWPLRLLPLRAGDLFRVSLEQGHVNLPCGELLAIEPATGTCH